MPMAEVRASPTHSMDVSALGESSRPKPKPEAPRPEVLFSFAVISDLHDEPSCDVSLGAKLPEAVKVLNSLDPDFVVGAGDLVAGGGDCLEWGRGYPEHELAAQLERLRRELLEPLDAPFVPLSGNHDLSLAGTRDRTIPERIWAEFWKAQAEHVLPEARPLASATNHRFLYMGVGFSLLGFNGTLGLHPKELAWAEHNLRTGDLVFRHVNPYGISCHSSWNCGFAIRSWPSPAYERLTELLSARRVSALFAGHTHAFFDGHCDGLRFVNTGSLGDRSMEFIKGWHESPFKKRQAFVWVDVLREGPIRVTFFVWDPSHRTFLPFDNRFFPKALSAEKKQLGSFFEGVSARCISNRLPPDVHWSYLRRRAETARMARLASRPPTAAPPTP
ncbi:MAG: metallophosphoesterase, partial [Polyangia bacterium]|nr:metallophosphoesterase [Polyangia bacterium]